MSEMLDIVIEVGVTNEPEEFYCHMAVYDTKMLIAEKTVYGSQATALLHSATAFWLAQSRRYNLVLASGQLGMFSGEDSNS